MGRPDRIGRSALTKVLQLMENSIKRPVDRNWLCSAKFATQKESRSQGDRRPESGADRLKACPTMRRFVFEKT